MIFSSDQRIRHAAYGNGTILHSDEQRTEIQFDQYGRKKFVTRMVQLEATDEPAPARSPRRSRKKAEQ